MGHHHARGSAELALVTDAVTGYARLSPGQQSGQHTEQLALVVRAPAQLEVDCDMAGDRRRGGKGCHVVRPGVNGRAEFCGVSEVAERLDAACGGTRSDGDQRPRRGPDLTDALGVGRSRHRSLDEGHVIWSGDVGVRGLGEMRDVYLGGESEQFVLAVEHGELASIAGREFPDGQLGPRAIGHLELPDRKQRRGGAARPVPLTHDPCSRDPPGALGDHFIVTPRMPNGPGSNGLYGRRRAAGHGWPGADFVPKKCWRRRSRRKGALRPCGSYRRWRVMGVAGGTNRDPVAGILASSQHTAKSGSARCG